MGQARWELPWKPLQAFLVRADPAKWHFGALAPTRLPERGHSTLAEDILGSPWGWLRVGHRSPIAGLTIQSVGGWGRSKGQA